MTVIKEDMLNYSKGCYTALLVAMGVMKKLYKQC